MESRADVSPAGAVSARPAVCPPPYRRPFPSADEIVRRYGSALQVQVWRTLYLAGARPCGERVQEFLQEVYCHILSAQQGGRLEACRGTGTQIEGYLCRLAERVVLDVLRAARALKRDPRPEARRGGTPPKRREHDSSGTVLDRLLAQEQLALFLLRCEQLAGERRGKRDARIVQLALIEGWTSVEISRAMGGRPTPSTIDSLVHRLKRRLATEGLEISKRARGPWPTGGCRCQAGGCRCQGGPPARPARRAI